MWKLAAPFFLLMTSVSSAAPGQDCVRKYDLILQTVVESCKPSPVPNSTPAAAPVSVTAPKLTVPSGVVPVTVQRVVDPATLEVTYEYALRLIRLKDVVIPDKGTAEYREALNLMRSMAPASSSLYFEKTGAVDKDQAMLGYVWQLGNLVNLVMLERGLARLDGKNDSDYLDLFMPAENWAKDRKLGIWAMPQK